MLCFGGVGLWKNDIFPKEIRKFLRFTERAILLIPEELKDKPHEYWLEKSDGLSDRVRFVLKTKLTPEDIIDYEKRLTFL